MNVVEEIFNMMFDEYVAIALKRRKGYLQLDSILFDISKTFHPQPFILDLYNKYAPKFLSDSYDNLSAIGIAPFIMVTEHIDITDVIKPTKEEEEVEVKLGRKLKRKRTIKMPVALVPKSYNVETFVNINGQKEYKFYLKNRKEQPKFFWINSKFRSGINEYDTNVVDSDCAPILRAWIKLNEYKRDAEEIRTELKKPIRWLQKVFDKVYGPNMHEEARAEKILSYRRDPNGYKLPGVTEVEINREQNLAIVPGGHILSAVQPSPSLELLNLKEAKVEFKSLVDETLGMAIQSSKTAASAFHTRTNSAVEETKADRSAMLHELVSDLSYIGSLAFKMCMEDTSPESISISIPMRSVADENSIYKLHGYGVINDNVAREELLKINGMQTHRGTKGPLKRARHEKEKEKEKEKEYEIVEDDNN